MISLTAAQYEAIGEVAVQSGTLERELVEIQRVPMRHIYSRLRRCFSRARHGFRPRRVEGAGVEREYRPLANVTAALTSTEVGARLTPNRRSPAGASSTLPRAYFLTCRATALCSSSAGPFATSSGTSISAVF